MPSGYHASGRAASDRAGPVRDARDAYAAAFSSRRTRAAPALNAASFP